MNTIEQETVSIAFKPIFKDSWDCDQWQWGILYFHQMVQRGKETLLSEYATWWKSPLSFITHPINTFGIQIKNEKVLLCLTEFSRLRPIHRSKTFVLQNILDGMVISLRS